MSYEAVFVCITNTDPVFRCFSSMCRYTNCFICELMIARLK